MSFDINIYDGMPPATEIGYVEAIEDRENQKGGVCGRVLLKIPKRIKGEKDYTIVPFFFGAAIWGRYKSQLKKGDMWRFHYKLSGNETNGIHYCNASVTSAFVFAVTGKYKSNQKAEDLDRVYDRFTS